MRRVWAWLGWGAALIALWLALLQLHLTEEQRRVMHVVSVLFLKPPSLWASLP